MLADTRWFRHWIPACRCWNRSVSDIGSDHQCTSDNFYLLDLPLTLLPLDGPTLVLLPTNVSIWDIMPLMPISKP